LELKVAGVRNRKKRYVNRLVKKGNLGETSERLGVTKGTSSWSLAGRGQVEKNNTDTSEEQKKNNTPRTLSSKSRVGKGEKPNYNHKTCWGAAGSPKVEEPQFRNA